MTTNVFCKKKNILASDSRWSFKPINDRVAATFAVAYIDNTGYDKIVYDGDTGFIFAGSIDVIDKWRDWVISPLQQSLKRPDVADDFSICMTDLDTGDILYEHGQKVSGEFCRMAGTGAKAAYECWDVNGDAKTAVISATKADVFSGGEVKYLEGGNRKNNLNFTVSKLFIKEQFLKKGMVMYTATNQAPIPLEQAKSDPRIQQLVSAIEKDTISAEAPSGFDPVVWTPADENRLDAALATRAAKRAALNC